MQVDFTSVRRGRSPLIAFVATLGYSRTSFVRFTQAEDFAVWRDCVLGAFDYFGGVAEEVLFDNAKLVVLERDLYGPGPAPLSSRHARARGALRLPLRLCGPYRAPTKGKVARFNSYLHGQLRRAAGRHAARLRGWYSILISAIARAFALDGNTMRRALRDEAWRSIDGRPGGHAARAAVEFLQTRVTQVGYSAQILYQELSRLHGFRSRYETVRVLRRSCSPGCPSLELRQSREPSGSVATRRSHLIDDQTIALAFGGEHGLHTMRFDLPGELFVK